MEPVEPPGPDTSRTPSADEARVFQLPTALLVTHVMPASLELRTRSELTAASRPPSADMDNAVQPVRGTMLARSHGPTVKVTSAPVTSPNLFEATPWQ